MDSHRDPVCGMTGTIEKHGNWFCSPACIARYEEQLRAKRPPPLWKTVLRDPLLWAFLLVAVPLILGTIWPPAAPVAHSLKFYLIHGGWAIALGLLLGGLIDHFVPKEYISLSMAGQRKRTVLTSAGLGFLASSCSHGCLAISMELYRKGASVSSVITFLLASPWASLPMTLLILSLMGWKGLLVILVALGIAITTGLIFQKLERSGRLSSNPNTVALSKDFSIGQDLKRRLQERRRRFQERSSRAASLRQDLKGVARGTMALARMVLLWVALGFTVSALLGTVIPEGWWSRFFGPTFLGLLSTLGVATVIEVCSEGTAPLAVELFRQTGALGNAFAFLMGGVVTDLTELSLLWGNLGRRVVGWFLGITLPQVFLWGLLMNLLWS